MDPQTGNTHRENHFIVCDTLRICSRLICFVSLLCVFQLMWCCPLVSRSKCPALTSGDIIRCFTDIRHCPGAPPRTRPPRPGRSWLPAPASPARWAPWWPGSPSWASSAWNKNHNQSPDTRVCSMFIIGRRVCPSLSGWVFLVRRFTIAGECF